MIEFVAGVTVTLAAVSLLCWFVYRRMNSWLDVLH